MNYLIAGSRDRYVPGHVIGQSLATLAPNYDIQGLTVISGNAMGMDLCGEHWAQTFNIPVKQFIPDWNGLGKKAGHVRNAQMAEVTDIALIVWNGSSKGTQGMIRNLVRLEIPHIAIVDYDGKYYQDPQDRAFYFEKSKHGN